MYRSDWELVTYVHDHITNLADDCRAFSPIDHHLAGLTLVSLLTQLRQRMGIALIRIGHALAGADAVRRLPAPPARPAT